jgi:hypothetical protein
MVEKTPPKASGKLKQSNWWCVCLRHVKLHLCMTPQLANATLSSCIVKGKQIESTIYLTNV